MKEVLLSRDHVRLCDWICGGGLWMNIPVPSCCPRMKIGLGAVRSAAGDWIPPGAAVAHVMPCGSDVPANCHGENCIG